MEKDKFFIKYPIIGATYQHYKGGSYEVQAIAKHSETGEVMVVYRSKQFGDVYVRPMSMWFDTVENHEGYKRPRFSI